MESRNHAVVLGASLAGLLAARALSGQFKRVTLIERDTFPPAFEQRKGVPQGRHAHGFLASGYRIAEELFPGVGNEIVAGGALCGDTLERGHWCIGGQLLRKGPSDLFSMTASRPLLEAHLRQRLLALPNVEAIENCDAVGLDGDERQINGVRLLRRIDNSAEQVLASDLVVDATGRGSRMPAWLKALGSPVPDEERVRVDISYLTGIFPRDPTQLGGDRVVIIGAAPPNRRCGVALAFEQQRWIVTLVGYLGDSPPDDVHGFAEFARTLPASMIHEIVREAQPLGPLVSAKFPFSRRWRYERLPRFPRGLLVFGDALCSFNPIYGQGISVAALEAKLLERCIASGGEAWRSFFTGAARIIDTPWSIAVGNDLRFAEVDGKRAPGARWVNAYMRRLLRAAATDHGAAVGFLRVTHLVAPPSSLFSPAMLLRVLRFGAATVPGALVSAASRDYAHLHNAE
jgi:2-polyprenyl-6-methoxyphenol hydroxylase-like FAD-dependent oxidoreductase